MDRDKRSMFHLNNVFDPFRNMRLIAKITLLGASSVFFTAVALVIIAVWQSRQYNELAQSEVEDLINADLDHITTSIYNLVSTENEAVQSQVNAHLNVARHLLVGHGGVSLAKEHVKWSAINQFTKKAEELTLPKMLVNKQWLGQNTDLAVETPIVDEATRLVGETATIFQRMNERGDMLRVATTVKTATNERAIGTYIPAVNPDGTNNSVVSTILKGETYHGRAYVVNTWYITAYEPIKDLSGNIVGMLYVGIKQKTVESRVRHAILQTRVGKTGYVFVLGGGGEDKGHYVISKKGERDGEDVWASRDRYGLAVIQEIINRATLLQPGQVDTVQYRWQNPDEKQPRLKIARLAYYAPWDWVIGTSVYIDELQGYRNMLEDGWGRMTRIMGIAGAIITALVGLVGLSITWSITSPVRQITDVAEKIIAGDLNQVVHFTSRDEIGVLARTFNLMTGKLKNSLEKLQRSEEKYRGIFENALEGVFQSSVEGYFLSVNPALARILGYDSPEEVVATITDMRRTLCVNPDDCQAYFETMRHHDEGATIEVQFYRKNKEIIWVSISARMRYGADGNPLFIEGFITDISARKNAEEALAESRNFLNEIITAVGDPLFVKNSQYRLILVNNAMCAFTGRSRQELLGKTVNDLFRKEEAAVFQANDELVMTTGVENINEETFTDGRGVLHTILTKKTLYLDKNNEKFIVGIIRDITEQKLAEEERIRLETRLTQSQKMEAIGTLAGGIAHDFNNILQPILGYSELLKSSLSPEESLQDYVQRIYEAGLRAKDLVTQILAFSRQSEHKTLPVKIQTILNEVFKLSRATIPATIVINKDIQHDCPPVMMDPSQLHQIAMNLVVNSYHALEQSGGEISIGLKEVTLSKEDVMDKLLEPGHYAMFSVSDNGCGIDPSIMGKVFEPYFTTKAQGKGTGLGLAVVYGIVKEHRGDIKIYSEVGTGTTINVYLPVTGHRNDALSAHGEESYATGTEHILVVDDEKMIVEMEKLMLERLGYKVTACQSSGEALEIFHAAPQNFDLVITDMTMPIMTGEELARKLIAIKQDIPIIMCTGFSERMGQNRARNIGIKEFLMKPVTTSQMSQKVRNLLVKS